MTATMLTPSAKLDVSPTQDFSVTPDYRMAVAINAIVDEVGCSADEAYDMVVWVSQFVEAARTGSYRLLQLNDEQLRSPEYNLFDAIMPHGEISERGTAHYALEGALLDPTREEFGIMHAMSDEPDSPTYCTVQVIVSVIR